MNSTNRVRAVWLPLLLVGLLGSGCATEDESEEPVEETSEASLALTDLVGHAGDGEGEGVADDGSAPGRDGVEEESDCGLNPGDIRAEPEPDPWDPGTHVPGLPVWIEIHET